MRVDGISDRGGIPAPPPAPLPRATAPAGRDPGVPPGPGTVGPAVPPADEVILSPQARELARGRESPPPQRELKLSFEELRALAFGEGVSQVSPTSGDSISNEDFA